MLKTINLQRDDAGNLLPFSTPKHNYTPIKIGNPVGVTRWTEYEKLAIVLGTGKTFSQIIEWMEGHEKQLAANKDFAEIRLECILEVNSLRRSFVEMSQARSSYAFYLATLFIVEDNDPAPLEWSIAKADKIIEDWRTSGVNEQDLFFFALNLVVGYKEFYKKERARAEAEAERLSVITGLTQTESDIF
jgi:hypothetical protein